MVVSLPGMCRGDSLYRAAHGGSARVADGDNRRHGNAVADLRGRGNVTRNPMRAQRKIAADCAAGCF
ncbi:hypothetical protein TUM17580_33170 [Citrobacter farmeri]|nr:hypothetical protein TUM17580_33170 [Citrobacter farmeri]